MKDSESEPVRASIVLNKPSNFQTMKKFIKNKIGNHCHMDPMDSMDTLDTPNNKDTNHTTENKLTMATKQVTQIRLKTEVIDDSDLTPPMPLLLSPKKEIDDDLTFSDSSQSSSDVEMLSHVKTESTATSTSTNSPTVDVCRDYLRNNCTHVNCKYRHEFDESKIPELYKFCKDFQNKGCKHPNCKYAHATVVEQEWYYKTFYLPPHALSHQKPKSSVKDNGPLRVKTHLNGVPTSWRKTPPPPPTEKTCIEPAAPSIPNGLDPVLSQSCGPSSDTSISKRRCVSAPLGVYELIPLSVPQGVKLKCEKCMLLENRIQKIRMKVSTMQASTNDYLTKLETFDRHEKRIVGFLLQYLRTLFISMMDTELVNPSWEVNGKTSNRIG